MQSQFELSRSSNSLMRLHSGSSSSDTVSVESFAENLLTVMSDVRDIKQMLLQERLPQERLPVSHRKFDNITQCVNYLHSDEFKMHHRSILGAYKHMRSIKEILHKYNSGNVSLTAAEFGKIRDFKDGMNFKRPCREKGSKKLRITNPHHIYLLSLRQEYLDYLSAVEYASNFFHPDDPFKDYIPNTNPQLLLQILVDFIYYDFFQGLTEVQHNDGTVCLFSYLGGNHDISVELRQKHKTKRRASRRHETRSSNKEIGNERR